MEHALIYTIIGSVLVAYLFGMVAGQLRLPPLFGYLLAGIAIGPHTPGFVADLSLANQLAEIGIILLMFGVGLHFSLEDLKASRRVALPGALVQILVATGLGALAAQFLGVDLAGSLIYGLALSVASTIVLIRSFEQRNLLEATAGKIAISWLVVEDIAMVLALILLPVIAGSSGDTSPHPLLDMLRATGEVLLKLGLFFALMLLIGRRVLPRLLAFSQRFASEELNTLSVLAIALGCALLAYVVFDASLALGAFLAGVMLNETDIGRRSVLAASQIRDAFSVLFFVSVGMLFDPLTLWQQPVGVLVTCGIIIVAKTLVAMAIGRALRVPKTVLYPVAAGLAQIGEFSFILGGLGLHLHLISQEVYNLILAGAMLSIVLNPFLFRWMDSRLKQPH